MGPQRPIALIEVTGLNGQWGDHANIDNMSILAMVMNQRIKHHVLENGYTS